MSASLGFIYLLVILLLDGPDASQSGSRGSELRSGVEPRNFIVHGVNGGEVADLLAAAHQD